MAAKNVHIKQNLINLFHISRTKTNQSYLNILFIYVHRINQRNPTLLSHSSNINALFNTVPYQITVSSTQNATTVLNDDDDSTVSSVLSGLATRLQYYNSSLS